MANLLMFVLAWFCNGCWFVHPFSTYPLMAFALLQASQGQSGGNLALSSVLLTSVAGKSPGAPNRLRVGRRPRAPARRRQFMGRRGCRADGAGVVAGGHEANSTLVRAAAGASGDQMRVTPSLLLWGWGF